MSLRTLAKQRAVEALQRADIDPDDPGMGFRNVMRLSVDAAADVYEAILRPLAEAEPYTRVTFGQGHEGVQCRFCGADNYGGIVNHKDDCLWVVARESHEPA